MPRPLLAIERACSESKVVATAFLCDGCRGTAGESALRHRRGGAPPSARARSSPLPSPRSGSVGPAAGSEPPAAIVGSTEARRWFRGYHRLHRSRPIVPPPSSAPPNTAEPPAAIVGSTEDRRTSRGHLRADRSPPIVLGVPRRSHVRR